MRAKTDDGPDQRWLTWPNIVTSFRIVGSPALVLLAIANQITWLAVAATLLVISEWLDGFLARRLHQHSVTGARLDTIADAVFYASLLIAVAILNPGVVVDEVWWIAAAIGSYLLSWLVSWIKFRRLPSYHTWAAKGVWVLVGAGIICLLANWTPWPFRVAMIGVGLANLEAIAISVLLSDCRVNVATVFNVLGRRFSNSSD